MASKELRLNGQGLPRESQNQTGLRRERNLQRILQRAASEASLRFPLIGSWPRSPVEAEMNCPSHYLKPRCGENVCLLFLRVSRVVSPSAIAASMRRGPQQIGDQAG